MDDELWPVTTQLSLQAEIETLCLRLAKIDIEFYEDTIRLLQGIAHKLRVERAVARHYGRGGDAGGVSSKT